MFNKKQSIQYKRQDDGWLVKRRRFVYLIKFLIVLSFPKILLAHSDELLVFSSGWMVKYPSLDNIIEIGKIYPCGDIFCASVDRYYSKKNIERTKLNVFHEMRIVTSAKNCRDGNLTTVIGDRVDYKNIKINVDNKKLEVDFGLYIQKWEARQGFDKKYILKEIKIRDGNVGSIEQVVGWASWSDSPQNKNIYPEKFLNKYIGEIAHKDMLTSIESEWKISRTSFFLNKFTQSVINKNIYSFITLGKEDVSKRAGKSISVWHTFLTPVDYRESLSTFIHEYGHDFNGNGCFDDLGHNKFLLPIFRADLVDGFVFIEYSPDPRDGVPMISVGNYEKE